jgi:hypothetical protein
MGKLMKNGVNYSGWGSPGGGGASGPVVWVETSDSTVIDNIYPSRQSEYEVTSEEGSEGSSILTMPYEFTDESTGNTVTVTFTVGVDYYVSGNADKYWDQIFVSEYTNSLGDEYDGIIAQMGVTVDSVSVDDSNVSDYEDCFSELEAEPYTHNGHVCARIPYSIDFSYNGQTVDATFSGESDYGRDKYVGTYDSTVIHKYYILGIAQS